MSDSSKITFQDFVLDGGAEFGLAFHEGNVIRSAHQGYWGESGWVANVNSALVGRAGVMVALKTDLINKVPDMMSAGILDVRVVTGYNDFEHYRRANTLNGVRPFQMARI